jgi:hypothetical protein
MTKSRQLHIIAEAAKKTKTETVMGKLANDNDPMEPWSKKHAPLEEEQLDEAGTLAKYIKSLGYDPKVMDFATRSKYARSNAFKKFKVQHWDDKDPKTATDIKLGEDIEELDEAGTGLLMSYIKAKGLDPTLMDGNKKAAYSKSSEFRAFKHKRLKEISGMGERGEDMAEGIAEESDKKDIVSMDIPLLIRVLEYAREDAKTDMDLHKVVENLIDMRGEGPLTMDHYDSITSIKEDADPCWTGYQMVGMKKKGKREVPNCVPKKSVKEDLKEGNNGKEDLPWPMKSNKKNYSKSARIIKNIYKKKGVKKETTYDWEKDDKGGPVEPTAKKILSGGKTMTGKDRDQVEIEPILKTRPNQKM